jgi:hypothetical protein
MFNFKVIIVKYNLVYEFITLDEAREFQDDLASDFANQAFEAKYHKSVEQINYNLTTSQECFWANAYDRFCEEECIISERTLEEEHVLYY